MSEFIEFGFPCIDCLDAAACKDRTHIRNKDLLDQQGGGVRCLALPTFDPETSSHEKMLIECLASMSWRIGQKLNDDRDGIKKMPAQYRHFLIEYLGILEWITNSTSWRENFDQVADFDKFEIRNKMKMLSGMLDWKGD